MSDKNGNGYILPCISMLFICSVISVMLTYFSAVHTVNTSRKEVRTVLDNYVTSDSISIFNTLKNSSDNISSVDASGFSSNIAAYCGLEQVESSLYSLSADGSVDYKLSKPRLSFVTEEELKLRASYEITVPMRLFGVEITQLTVPITIDSLYNAKF